MLKFIDGGVCAAQGFQAAGIHVGVKTHASWKKDVALIVSDVDCAASAVFTPIVDDYYKGMATTVPFHMSQMQGVSTLAEVRQKLADHYAGQAMVAVSPDADTAKIYANAQAGKDTLELIVAGNDEQFSVTALFDNLGKGASGAAVQNMNLMLGFDETTGLNL